MVMVVVSVSVELEPSALVRVWVPAKVSLYESLVVVFPFENVEWPRSRLVP